MAMTPRDSSIRVDASGESLYLDQLPFFTGVLDNPGNRGLPLTLPFTLAWDADQGLIVSRHGEETVKAMEAGYRLGSLVSTTLGEGSFGERRAREVLDLLIRAEGGRVQGRSFLEVGCGGGYLLHRLSQMGASRVLGCEPGPRALDGQSRYGIDILQEFYRPGLVREIFDVVFSYGVLEHIARPREFLQAMLEPLREGGHLFVGVPNCEEKLALGDLEILGHEHWNYFTAGTLARILRHAGLSDVEVTTGMNQAMIYGWGTWEPARSEGPPPPDIRENALLRQFVGTVQKILPLLQERLDALEQQGGRLCLYGGGINTVGLLHHQQEPRFFNSDVAVHGKYYPGFRSPIEDPRNLRNGSVEGLWIMATDYDHEIRQFLETEIRIPERTRIFSYRDCLLRMARSSPLLQGEYGSIRGMRREDHDTT